MYNNVVKGVFLKRPNRFIANVFIDGKEEICHVKNTGRCKELLLEGTTVYLEESKNPLRKTKYDLIAVKKGEKLINIDSVKPNEAVFEFLKKKYPSIRREVFYKNSRFDIYIEDEKTYIEVKGVTLEKDNIAMFPDAPTDRGRKHILELIDAIKNGYLAKIIFVIQFEGAERFIPNYKTDPRFKEALCEAQKQGVIIEAFDCFVTPENMKIKDRVEVCLDSSLPI